MRWDSLQARWAAGNRRRRGPVHRRPPGPGAPAHRARRGRPHLRHAGLPWHDLLRGAGQVRRQPCARCVQDAVPVDHQPLPRLPACVHLLHRGRDAHPDGERPDETARRGTRRRRDLRHHQAWLLPPLRDHHGAGALVYDQARLPGHPGGRHPTHLQRGSSLPDRTRLEACNRDRVRSVAAPAPDRQQQADGGRRLRGAAEGDRSLPARLPMRHNPRRRERYKSSISAAWQITGSHLQFPARTDRPRSAD